MPDRPDDLEPDVRHLLEDMASAADPPSKAPPAVVRTARRRLLRNSAALMAALSVVAGAVVIGAGLASGDHRPGPVPIGSGGSPSPTPEQSSTSTSGPSATPTKSGTSGWTGSLPVMLFVDGVVYDDARSSNGPSPTVLGSVPQVTAAQPPVDTPFGVLVLGGVPGRGTDLWLVHADSLDSVAPDRLATNLDGFAVSADGSRLAYATLTDGSQRSELIERSLQTGAVLHSASVDTYVRVVGYAADVVVLDTGDGAAASVATWQPGTSSFVLVDGYGTAVAADPDLGFAALHQGDGVCWSIVQLGPRGQPGHGPPKPGPGCGLAQASFDPNGAIVAGVELISEDRNGPQRLVLAGTTTQLGGELEVDGAFQTRWVDPQHVLVVEEPAPGQLAVQRCEVSENICPDGPVWTGTGDGGEGWAWLVEERPTAG